MYRTSFGNRTAISMFASIIACFVRECEFDVIGNISRDAPLLSNEKLGH